MSTSTTILHNVYIWNEHWGKGYFQYLLLAAGLLLLMHMKKRKQALVLLGYLTIGIFIYWFPPTSYFIKACIGDDVYWRYLWIIPIIPIIAYTATWICEIIPFWFIRVFAVAAFLFLFTVSGKSIWQADLYEKVENPQKVPQVVADVCDIIKADAGDTQVMLAAEEDLATYIRIYEPSFRMRYGRGAKGQNNSTDQFLYQLLTDTVSPFNGEGLMRTAKKLKCNYLIVTYRDPDSENAYIEENGYKRIGMIEKYGIYRRS